MFARVLSILAALLLAAACTDTRAYAYPQALELKNPHLGFFTLDLNPFQEKSPLSPSVTKEKTLEIAAASIGRGNYLRARYMDPGRGRFLGMDPWGGSDDSPPSIHRYLYGNASPTVHVDPSGMVSLIDLSSAQNLIARMILDRVQTMAFDGIAQSFTNGIVTRVSSGTNLPKTGNTTGASLVMALAAICRSGKGKCLLAGIPTFVSGIQFPYSSAHIALSQFGNGNTADQTPKPLPFILMKRIGGRDDVDPRRGKKGCPGDVKAFVCDEYPYASTEQGGKANYKAGLVSLLWVPKIEGSRQGNYLKRFYQRAEIFPGTPLGVFFNVGIPMIPTGFITRKGKWENL